MYLKVQVIPESKEEHLRREAEDSFVAQVREKAEQGRANRSVLELVREYFGKGMRVRIVSGHHSSHKIISVEKGSISR